MKNESLAFINALRDRISNDLVLTLAELSEQKIGQTTFYFASEKLGILQDEVQEYRRFIVANKLKEKEIARLLIVNSRKSGLRKVISESHIKL